MEGVRCDSELIYITSNLHHSHSAFHSHMKIICQNTVCEWRGQAVRSINSLYNLWRVKASGYWDLSLESKSWRNTSIFLQWKLINVSYDPSYSPTVHCMLGGGWYIAVQQGHGADLVTPSLVTRQCNISPHYVELQYWSSGGRQAELFS